MTKNTFENLPEIASPKQVASVYQINRTTLWRWEKTIPNFPKPKRFSPRKTGYIKHELIAFNNSL